MSSNEPASEGLKRREFIKLALASTAVLAGPRLMKRPSASKSGEESPHHWVMVIDQARCIGCGYCTQACRAHNDVPPDISWNRIIEDNENGDREAFLPMPCMHCEDAPCVNICPVEATYHRGDGIVMMDYERCIGCRYCELACPYGARSFNWKAFTGENPAVPEWGQPGIPRRPRGVVEKCSFCFQRIDRGLAEGYTPGVDSVATPACVNVCPVDARHFGDLNDPDSLVSKLLSQNRAYQLKANLGTRPRVFYLPIFRDEKEEVHL